MNIKNAKGERWTVFGVEKSHPMFKESEIEKASAIVETLSGLTIEEAKSILKRVSESLDQLIVVPGIEEPEHHNTIDQDAGAMQAIANAISENLSTHDTPQGF